SNTLRLGHMTMNSPERSSVGRHTPIPVPSSTFAMVTVPSAWNISKPLGPMGGGIHDPTSGCVAMSTASSGCVVTDGASTGESDDERSGQSSIRPAMATTMIPISKSQDPQTRAPVARLHGGSGRGTKWVDSPDLRVTGDEADER